MNLTWKKKSSTKFSKRALEFLTRLSKAFMLPISILPIAGLLLGLGGAIGANVKASGAQDFANFLKGMSEVIFANLPILFGASIAMAFTKINTVSCVFMTLVAYFAFSGVQNAFIHYETTNKVQVFKDIFYFHTDPNLKYLVGANLGIRSMQTSIFGGLIVGGIVAWVLNRFSEIELPNALSFFSGIRLVPMILLPLMALLSIFFLIFWPWVGKIISLIGNSSNSAPGGLDGLVYGMLGRTLMPFGLHHVVIGMAWQSNLGGQINLQDVKEVATTLDVLDTQEIKALMSSIEKKGGSVNGDQNIWVLFNGLSFNRIPTNNHGGSLPAFEWATKHLGQHPGRFQQDYPIYIGACMGIGTAIIVAADKEHRRKTLAMTGAAMAVAFLTGITEPLEFSFLFVAPLFYYAVYVPLSGLAYMLMKVSGAHIGVGFARGFIDLIIYGVLPVSKGTHFYWAFIYALLFALVSFASFYFMIRKFNWATPGRQGNVAELITKKTYKELKKQDSETQLFVEAYGGANNIISVTACATRLRVLVVDPLKVNETQLQKLGSQGFIKKDNASQLILGGKAIIVANKINQSYGIAISANAQKK